VEVLKKLKNYKIEKLQDWEKIGFVEGHGNSNSPKDYSFTDNSASYGKYAYRLKQIDTDGQFEYSKVIEVDAGNIPNGFVLYQNYPNPFNPVTKIEYTIAEFGYVTLKVYDIIGNEVKILVNDEQEAGNYESRFDASGLSSGIYIYRLTAAGFISSKKMIIIK